MVFLLCGFVWCSSVIHRTHCIVLVHLVNLLVVGYHQSSFVSLEIVRLVVLTVLRRVFIVLCGLGILSWDYYG